MGTSTGHREGKHRDGTRAGACSLAVTAPLLALPLSAVFLLIVFVAGCTSAPKETVELAEIVDQQIAAMQTSHERFVSLYYARLRADVDTFIEQRFIPTLLEIAIDPEATDESGRFREDLDRAYRIATVDTDAVEIRIDEERVQDPAVRDAMQEAVENAIAKGRADLGLVLIDFSQGITTEIEKQRAQMMAPIDEQEAFVLNQLREGYADLLRGSAAIKGYLASVVKLTEERDAVLARLGLLETQRKIVDAAVRASDGAARALRVAEDADGAITSFLEGLEDARGSFREILDGSPAGNGAANADLEFETPDTGDASGTGGEGGT